MNASSAAATEGRRDAAISSRAAAGISVSGVGEREAKGEGERERARFWVFDDLDLLDDFDAFDDFVSDVFDFLVAGCCGRDDDSESDEDVSDDSEEDLGSRRVRISHSGRIRSSELTSCSRLPRALLWLRGWITWCHF